MWPSKTGPEQPSSEGKKTPEESSSCDFWFISSRHDWTIARHFQLWQSPSVGSFQDGDEIAAFLLPFPVGATRARHSIRCWARALPGRSSLLNALDLQFVARAI